MNNKPVLWLLFITLSKIFSFLIDFLTYCCHNNIPFCILIF